MSIQSEYNNLITALPFCKYRMASGLLKTRICRKAIRPCGKTLPCDTAIPKQCPLGLADNGQEEIEL
jgi:hypothetical protein